MPQGGVLEHDRMLDPHPIADAVDVVVADTAVVAFVPHPGRITSCLVMPVIGRLVDVSVSPRAALLAIHQAAEQCGIPRSQAEAITRRTLASAVHRASAWTAQGSSNDGSLITLIGGASFPLLGAAYDEGAGAIDEVPRWAAPILSATTVRDGATRAFGAKATRPVVAAFAQSLTRNGSDLVDLSRLGFALIASEVLGPDHLARVLTCEGRAWPLQRLPEPHLLDEGRRVAARWGVDRTTNYVEDACADENGLHMFVECIRYAADLGAHAPHRLPSHLSELHDLYRSRFSSRPVPHTQPPRARTQRSQANTRADVAANRAPDAPDVRPRGRLAPAHPREGHGLRYAPAAPDAVQVSPHDRIPHPAWLRAIDGTAFGEFRIVLPGSCGDLATWARVLRNCLGTYDRAAFAGLSHLIGIDQNNRLRYVVEVTPQHRIRQFAGHANRIPSAQHYDTVVEFLTCNQIVR